MPAGSDPSGDIGECMGYFDDDYSLSEDEIEMEEGTESTKVKFDHNKMRIDFDASCFAEGIIREVAANVKKNLYEEIITEIKKDIVGDMKETVRNSCNEIVKDIVNDFMENEKVKINYSVWDEKESEELTLKQYSKRCIKECIESGEFSVVTGVDKDYSGRYRSKTQKYSFSEWIQNGLGIGNETKAYFDSEIDKIRKQVNADVKNAFDESTKTMLSQAVLQVLMANDTYKKIEQNISCIADRTEKR